MINPKTPEEMLQTARANILERMAEAKAKAEKAKAQREAAHALRQRRERIADLFPELVEALRACEAWLSWWISNQPSDKRYEADRVLVKAATLLAKAKEVRP